MTETPSVTGGFPNTAFPRPWQNRAAGTQTGGGLPLRLRLLLPLAPSPRLGNELSPPRRANLPWERLRPSGPQGREVADVAELGAAFLHVAAVRVCRLGLRDRTRAFLVSRQSQPVTSERNFPLPWVY